MKILKNKTYDNLLEDRKVQKEIIDHQKKSIHNQISQISVLNKNLCDAQKRGEIAEKLLSKSISNLAIKRFIIGKRASGKTHFIQNEIIPQLNGNYFVIDICTEYAEIPDKNKFVPDKKDGSQKILAKIKKAILQNKSKLIILDNYSLYSQLPIGEMFELWTHPDFEDVNFIAVFQDIRQIIDHLDYVDCTYNFGTNNNLSSFAKSVIDEHLFVDLRDYKPRPETKSRKASTTEKIITTGLIGFGLGLLIHALTND